MTPLERGMLLAVSTSFGSTCLRRRVGCVLTAKGKVVATGYNGSLNHLPHCLDEGCMISDGHCIGCVHGELNACLQARTSADTAYCTDQPCLTCLRALWQLGVRQVFWWRHYQDANREHFVMVSKLDNMLIQVDPEIANHLQKFYCLCEEMVR